MNFACKQADLAAALGIVGRAVSTRSTLPVLGNILLEAKDDQLRLAATNLEIGVNCWLGAKVEDEGAITVPARLLTEFVNSLPPERINMDLSVRTQTLHLSCARYEANIKGIDAADFPNLPTMDDIGNDVTLDLNAAQLCGMVERVAFAASSDTSHQTLTGVEVKFAEGRMGMAATDGFRLSLSSTAVEGLPSGEPLTVIVPAHSLAELARISANADDAHPIRVVVTEKRNQILFQVWGKQDKGGFQRVEMASQLIDARFPDYRGIIPKNYTTRTVVETASLLKAARVALLFARDNADIIKVTIAPRNETHRGRINLTATSNEMGDNVSELDAEVEGQELGIAFNGKYLIDILSRIDQPQIVIETTIPTRPGTFRPLGVEKEEFLHVIMPMQPK